MGIRLFLIQTLLLLCGGAVAQAGGELLPPAEPTGLEHAASIRANSLWPDSSEFSLTGQGVVIYQWEAADRHSSAHPDTAASALGGRVAIADSFTKVSGHATEVALIAIGNSTDPDSAGVAYGAEIKAFSHDDRWTEMAAMGSAGMKLSLHAYAVNYGWNGDRWWGIEEVDPMEDFHFGFYDAESVLWDQHAADYPYSFVVKPVGNWRGDSLKDTVHYYYDLTAAVWLPSSAPRQADGGTDGYDCIPPGAGAKNVLTVGAVDVLPNGWQDTADVVVRPKSAFGPVDDGRIKPDLVAGGNVTSHSGAAVAGVSALLQEHYFNTYSSFPLASTLKALLIHTTDEAGPHPGPDYKHGWGLLNALRAARHISDSTGLSHIIEDTLADGDTLTYYFYAEADELKATLCWTDPEGTPVPWQDSSVMLDNPTPMLVNDLDMRIVSRAVGDTAAPYFLTAANPAAPTEHGDNAVDNVEQVDLDNAAGGWYSVILYHKNTLQGGSQAFSLMISGGSRGLVWDGLAWSPFAPGAATKRNSILIREGTSVTLPASFKGRHMTIERSATVEIQ